MKSGLDAMPLFLLDDLLGPTRLLISEKSATYTIIWQVRVGPHDGG